MFIKKILRNRLSWISIIILLCLFVLLIKSSDNIEVRSIEKQIPTLNKLGVESFFNMDSCKYLEYENRKVKDNCQNRDYPGEDFWEFNQEDWNVFDQVIKLTNSEFFNIGLTYSNDGKIVKAVFDKDCFFCGTTYIYNPNYILPEDVPGKRKYHRINDDWYKLQQDPL